MDAVKEALASFGNSWSPQVPATLLQHYEPLQAAQNAKHSQVIKVEKGHKYGHDDRNRIDVYSPAATSQPRPVVVYFHGGGLVTGDNDITPSIYANIGYYFTRHGYVTCLGTYRLAKQTGHHPNGAEDCVAALQWVQTNIAKYGGDPDNIIALGASAGGFHLLTALFLGLLDRGPRPLTRGILTLSAPFTVSVADPARAAVLTDWFGCTDAWEVNGRYSPAALFRQTYLGSSAPTAAPPRERFPCALRLFVGEAEADEILEGTGEFVQDYRRRFGKLPVLEVLAGHNHVSYSFGLGLEDAVHEGAGRRLLAAVGEIAA